MAKPDEDPWFFEVRAVAFAKLVLTEQHDVRPYAGTDMALDLLVEIRANGHSPQRRIFGVQIVSFMDLPDTQEADERVLSHLGKDTFEASFPICVFAIGVRKPEGIYRWVIEPVVNEGRALLNRTVESEWQPLNQAGVARLIAKVNAWYDTQRGISARSANGRPSRTTTP